MRISLLNFTALFVFSAWLMGVVQIQGISRGACIFGTAGFIVIAWMLLALFSPAGTGQLDVKRNSLFMLFFAYSKFVVLFAIATFVALVITVLMGYDEVAKWLRSC